jgi:hypothetical protein
VSEEGKAQVVAVANPLQAGFGRGLRFVDRVWAEVG